MLDRTPCEPFTDVDAVALCCDEFADAENADDLIDLASAIVAQLSGWTIYGICEATVRPAGCIEYRTLNCCEPAVELQWPVRTIVNVTINGEPLPADEYAVVDNRYLLRMANAITRHNPGWAYRQRLDFPNGAQDTWSITYTFGTDIPWYAVAAANEIACELQRACAGAGECALPRTARSVSTQGLSLQLADQATDEITSRSDSMPAVARMLSIVNPLGVTMPTEVWSPDTPRLYRVV